LNWELYFFKFFFCIGNCNYEIQTPLGMMTIPLEILNMKHLMIKINKSFMKKKTQRKIMNYIKMNNCTIIKDIWIHSWPHRINHNPKKELTWYKFVCLNFCIMNCNYEIETPLGIMLNELEIVIMKHWDYWNSMRFLLFWSSETYNWNEKKSKERNHHFLFGKDNFPLFRICIILLRK